jgi:hypothetical protein
MNDNYPFYNLYCINMHCDRSIYKNINQIEIPFNEGNLLTTHICMVCNHPMTSTMEMEIEHLIAGVGVKLPGNPFYDTNY